MFKGNVIGHLGSDAKIYEKEGKISARFTISPWDRRSDKTKKDPTWITCFLNHTSSLFPFLKKGILVYVDGDISADVFIKDDGSAIPSITMSVQNVELIGVRKENDI